MAGRQPPRSTRRRCAWARTPLGIAYHDREWGVPVRDDRLLFEFLVLEGAQAGLSWETILGKRDHYRRVFDRFDPARVARYDARKVRALLADPGIVRNRAKVAAAIDNARAFLAVQAEFGTFADYVWGFVGGRPRRNAWRDVREAPAFTAGVRRPEPRPQAAGLPLRGLDDLLRLHAGGGPGERPHRRLLPLPPGESGVPARERPARDASRPWRKRAG